MKITAFLQNQWFHNPAQVRAMFARDTTGRVRPRIIAFALFRGCKTGRVLQQLLGEELCDAIHWEECSPEIGGEPSFNPPPDPEHIAKVLATTQPDIVVCFSRRGAPFVQAACRLLPACRVITCCHPAAWHASAAVELQDCAEEIKRLSKNVVEQRTPVPFETL